MLRAVEVRAQGARAVREGAADGVVVPPLEEVGGQRARQLCGPARRLDRLAPQRVVDATRRVGAAAAQVRLAPAGVRGPGARTKGRESEAGQCPPLPLEGRRRTETREQRYEKYRVNTRLTGVCARRQSAVGGLDHPYRRGTSCQRLPARPHPHSAPRLLCPPP